MMKDPRVDTILELEEKVEALNSEFMKKVEELGSWFRKQKFSILELELVDCADGWDILGVLEDEEPEAFEGDGEEFGNEDRYYELLEKFEDVLEKKRRELGRIPAEDGSEEEDADDED